MTVIIESPLRLYVDRHTHSVHTLFTRFIFLFRLQLYVTWQLHSDPNLSVVPSMPPGLLDSLTSNGQLSTDICTWCWFCMIGLTLKSHLWRFYFLRASSWSWRIWNSGRDCNPGVNWSWVPMGIAALRALAPRVQVFNLSEAMLVASKWALTIRMV